MTNVKRRTFASHHAGTHLMRAQLMGYLINDMTRLAVETVSAEGLAHIDECR
jgi:hypothetical protein